MTRSKFINDLRSRIWNLPVEEVSTAIRYYDNFIVNAGIENETFVLEKLGSPQVIAENIINEYNSNAHAATRDYSKTNPAINLSFGNGSNPNAGNHYSNQGNNTNNNYGYGNSNNGQRQHNNNYSNKRLYKSETDKMIFGVCGGLAEYFQIDPSLVRIIAVFVAFTGAGLLAYLVAGAILPDKSRL